MRQMVLAYIPVQGWIIDPYVYSFFNCSNEVLVFPLQYAEVVNSDIVPRDVTVVKYWGRSLLVFFKPLFTPLSITFVSVYDPTFLENRIFVLWGHKELFGLYIMVNDPSLNRNIGKYHGYNSYH